MNLNLTSAVFMFEAILGGLLVTMVTGWLAIKIARRFGIMDYPGTAPHKQHKNPTPLAGGIALMLSLLVLSIVPGVWNIPGLGKIIIPVALIFGLGLWDDIRCVRAFTKLGVQIVATIILIMSGIYIQIFQTNTFFFGGTGKVFLLMDYALTLVWVVGVTNAFNLVDSMDGLGTGLSAWAFAFFMLATYVSQQYTLSILSALLLGICIGLYFFNASPARLFLGDSGDQTLGFLMATLAILYNPLDAMQASSWFVPILLVGVPIFDTALVFFSRLRRKQPFYQAGTDHTYHRLVAWGLDCGRAVLVMQFAALILECAAFIAVSLPPFQANLVFAFCIVAGIVCIFILDARKRWA
jgi:UDP-GlcNAc:undecaprenyl-phosphate/decaprenyl-phosphate GlcNAc-1-phosphate transferase